MHTTNITLSKLELLELAELGRMTPALAGKFSAALQKLQQLEERPYMLNQNEVEILSVALNCINSDLPEYRSILRKLRFRHE